MSQLIRDTLTGTTVDSVPFLDGRSVREFIGGLDRRSPEERAVLDTDVMMLLSYVLLHERFKVASA
jgi:hypothetical protein